MSITQPFTAIARACFALALVLTAAVGASAQNAAPATIEGRVTNSRSGDYIEKAQVTVEGTTLETFTDSGGYFRLTNVPAGTARVHVFFTGFDVQVEPVTLAPGAIARRDFTLGSNVVKLENFVVATSKEMNGAAIA